MSYEYREISREGSIDEKGVRKYTRTFQVTTSQNQDGPGVVAAYVPINLYASYITPTETDLTAILKTKSARPINGELGIWEVVCEYDSNPLDFGNNGSSGGGPSGSPSNSQTQPDLRPWTIEFGTNKLTKVLAPEDLDGKSVVASNGQPFDPAPEYPAAHPTITITAFKAIGADSFANVALYTNTVNDGAWLGFGDQRVLCTEYKLTSQYEHGAWWWQKQVSFEVNPDGPWNPIKVLDCGTVYKKSGSLPPQPILDATGNPVTSPVPLNGGGMPLNAGDNLVYLDFTAYRKQNWAFII